MKKYLIAVLIFIYYSLYTIQSNAQAGKVGINTSIPQAMLHVKDSSVLFSGDTSINAGNPPVSGAGSSMMWYPDKAAFRAGTLTTSSSSFWNKDSIGYFSVALGVNVKAKGENSVAIGAGTTASEYASTAIGNQTIASGSSSTAMGRSTSARGTASTSMGDLTSATGLASTSMGFSTIASSQYSTAMGNNTLAFGFVSTAMGVNTEAIGDFSTAMGFGTTATGDVSTAMGRSTTSRAFASLTIGRLNDSIISSNPLNWLDTDPVFIIGNGSSDNARRNALIIAKNGETGINVANGMPQAMLHIKAAEISDNRHIRLEDDNTTSSANIFYTSDLVFKNNLAGGDFIFRNDVNSNIFSLFSSGNVTMLGSLTQNSDARLKKNIQPLQNSLQKILLLGGYHYNWKENYRDKSLQTGLLAQQVEKQMPELVQTDKEGIKSVNYNGMIPYLVEAVKELTEKLESEKQRNDLLEKEIHQIKKLLK
jgi:hypothetical protein